MKLGVAFLALLVSANTALADMIPASLVDLVGQADLILYGEIVELSADSYSLKVIQTIEGNQLQDSIQVQRFVDWTCGFRPVPYQVGQRVLAFLETKTQFWGKQTHHPIGAACEGELIQDGTAVVFCSGYSLEGYPETSVTLEGKTFQGQRMELAEMVEAVATVRACFWFGLNRDDNRIGDIKIRCSNLIHNPHRDTLLDRIISSVKIHPMFSGGLWPH